jgi:IS30 family transposase
MPQGNKRRRSFRHLNQNDRDRIEALLAAGHSQKDIALVLRVSAATISRERRSRSRKSGRYEAAAAHAKARVKRGNSKYQGMKIERYPALREHIIRELKCHRSPDEIAGRMKQENMLPRVNTNAIYKWLYSPFGQPYCRYLCTKRYRRRRQKQKTKREMIPNRVSLEKRPKNGIHAEGDQFVSSRKSATVRGGAIICVPVAQLLVGRMVDNRKPATMTRTVNAVTEHLAVDDLTLDNGIENKYHAQMNLPAYFCDPHSPWQKPHVENSIGLLRRWFIPKKTDLTQVSNGDFQTYLHILNRKYRKSLGYRSAYEVAVERGIIQNIPALAGGDAEEITNLKSCISG